MTGALPVPGMVCLRGTALVPGVCSALHGRLTHQGRERQPRSQCGACKNNDIFSKSQHVKCMARQRTRDGGADRAYDVVLAGQGQVGAAPEEAQ